MVQYNMSRNNEGGFIQILGNNINSGYRFNVSHGDGSRILGINGATQNGRLVNISSHCIKNGITQNCQSIGNFVYNNTIHIPVGLNPKIHFGSKSGETFFYNNIFVSESYSHTIKSTVNETMNTFKMDSNLFFPQEYFQLQHVIEENSYFEDPKLILNTQNEKLKYRLELDSPAYQMGENILEVIRDEHHTFHDIERDFFKNQFTSFNSLNVGADNSPIGNLFYLPATNFFYLSFLFGVLLFLNFRYVRSLKSNSHLSV